MTYYLTPALYLQLRFIHLLAAGEDMKSNKADGPHVAHDFMDKMIRCQYFQYIQNMCQILQ